MARQAFRAMGLIGLVAGLLCGVLTVADLPPAEARTGGARGGFHGGVTHPFTFNHGFVVNRTFVTNRVFVSDHFFFRPSHRNVFFLNVGIGGFFPGFPVAYPAYYPYYPSYYSPCGYYDAYGRWVNAPCPPYEPPGWAPY